MFLNEKNYKQINKIVNNIEKYFNTLKLENNINKNYKDFLKTEINIKELNYILYNIKNEKSNKFIKNDNIEKLSCQWKSNNFYFKKFISKFKQVKIEDYDKNLMNKLFEEIDDFILKNKNIYININKNNKYIDYKNVLITDDDNNGKENLLKLKNIQKNYFKFLNYISKNFDIRLKKYEYKLSKITKNIIKLNKINNHKRKSLLSYYYKIKNNNNSLKIDLNFWENKLILYKSRSLLKINKNINLKLIDLNFFKISSNINKIFNWKLINKNNYNYENLDSLWINNNQNSINKINPYNNLNIKNFNKFELKNLFKKYNLKVHEFSNLDFSIIRQKNKINLTNLKTNNFSISNKVSIKTRPDYKLLNINHFYSKCNIKTKHESYNITKLIILVNINNFKQFKCTIKNNTYNLNLEFKTNKYKSIIGCLYCRIYDLNKKITNINDHYSNLEKKLEIEKEINKSLLFNNKLINSKYPKSDLERMLEKAKNKVNELKISNETNNLKIKLIDKDIDFLNFKYNKILMLFNLIINQFFPNINYDVEDFVKINNKKEFNRFLSAIINDLKNFLINMSNKKEDLNDKVYRNFLFYEMINKINSQKVEIDELKNTIENNIKKDKFQKNEYNLSSIKSSFIKLINYFKNENFNKSQFLNFLKLFLNHWDISDTELVDILNIINK